MFLGPYRAAFLEFLRNLSPQIMLMTIALLASSGLDMHRFDWSLSGIRNVLPFAAIIAVLLGAVMANLTQFLDRLGDEAPEVRAALLEARKNVRLDVFPGRTLRLTWALLMAALRHYKVGLARWLTALLVVEIGVAGLFISAIPAATTLANVLRAPAHAAPATCAPLQDSVPLKSAR